MTGPQDPAAASGDRLRTGRARRRPLAKAAARSGSCLVIAAAAVWGAFLADSGPGISAMIPLPPGLCFLVAIYAVIAALCFLGYGVATLRKQRRSPPAAATPAGLRT